MSRKATELATLSQTLRNRILHRILAVSFQTSLPEESQLSSHQLEPASSRPLGKKDGAREHESVGREWVGSSEDWASPCGIWALRVKLLAKPMLGTRSGKSLCSLRDFSLHVMAFWFKQRSKGKLRTRDCFWEAWD